MRHRCKAGYNGVQVCARWQNSFQAFLEDIEPRPSPKHSIDRYPNNAGDYEPGNCRWATAKEQSNNRRARTDGRGLTVVQHIHLSERTEKVLKALAEADRRKMATYAGIVLERHAEGAGVGGGHSAG
ncbi:MAG: hypothetical protein J2P50_14075 [Hyphomicrobiaceae bacterium]|nr:hypothetical protein [Hyphomicrobiaceae bacterium]